MDNNLAEDSFSIVGLFDNEEIGSLTRQGARGGLIELVVDRVLSSNFYNPEVLDIQESLRLTYANSIVLSADVNHLFNPSFPGVYLEHHKPLPNIGVTLSLDPNGHMATDSIGLALAEELAKRMEIKFNISKLETIQDQVVLLVQQFPLVLVQELLIWVFLNCLCIL